MPVVRVLVVDDHPVVRAGLVAMVTDVPDVDVVGDVGTARDALALVTELRPTICLTDVRLPDMTGIDLCAALARRHPRVRTVLLSAHGDTLTVDAGFEAGASGYVLKTSEPAVILAAIRSVAHGEVFLDPSLAARIGSFGGSRKLAKGPFDLTAQELRVLEHLPRGLTNKGIGEALGISEDTVKTHLKRILNKLNAHDRAEAVAIAHREGLL